MLVSEWLNWQSGFRSGPEQGGGTEREKRETGEEAGTGTGHQQAEADRQAAIQHMQQETGTGQVDKSLVTLAVQDWRFQLCRGHIHSQWQDNIEADLTSGSGQAAGSRRSAGGQSLQCDYGIALLEKGASS